MNQTDPPSRATSGSPDGSPDLMLVEQAADYLQVSASSIRAYVRQGKLKAFRVAGLRRVLIPREELMKLLEPAREEDLSPRLG